MPTKQENKLVTKKDIVVVLTLWETATTQQIADKLGRSKQQVAYLATQMRKAGVKLPHKTKHGYLRGLIKEVMGEQNKK